MSVRVLITDDSHTMRKIIRRTFRQCGFDTDLVAEAANGEEALARLGERRFDVLLTDLKMPVMDGFELIRHIRADAALDDLIIIVISTETSPLYTDAALAAGADSFLAKPFTAEGLEEHFSKVVHEHQM